MTATKPGVSTFRSLPLKARLYVIAVAGAGGGCLAASLLLVRLEQPWLLAALMGLAFVAGVAKIDLPLGRGASNLSISSAVHFWTLFALGPAATGCVAVVGASAQSMVRGSVTIKPHRVIFNVAAAGLTVSLAGLPLAVMGWDTSTVAALVRAAAVVAPIYFFINTGLVAGAVALSTGQPFALVWQRNFLWSAPTYLAGAALGAAAMEAWARGSFGWLALLAVPLYLVFRSYHTVVARLNEEQDQTHRAMNVQLATIEALALAIEAKAGCTPEHVRSIQHYAALLADAAGLSDADVQTVRTAALLHDIGNLAVPEHILSKPDALTTEEFERVKIHPRVGAEILRDVPFGAPVSDLVLCHHERWDGLGYPAGLGGDDIPIGARILAIADCYSTLQTDRPYRPARTESAAMAVLLERAGTAFDPALVDLLIVRLNMSAPLTTDTAGQSASTESEPLALRDIAGAHREEQTLYEIAQALGSSLGVAEAMALIQANVSRLVPFTTCALFLRDDGDGYLCRYAYGPGADALLKWMPKSWSDLSLRLPSRADGVAPGDDLKSSLLCALMLEGQTIGGLVIYHTVPGCFTDEHRRLLGRVSEQAAAVIYNSVRFEKTEHDSHTDPLTGMANRRSLYRQFETGLERATHSHGSISLVVLDLDGLKEINDTYGHEAGDRALHAVGDVLRAMVRQDDVCARFAGDEFIVVLWDCSPEDQTRRAAELQKAVAAWAFEARRGIRVPLSISAGTARFPEDGRTFEALLAAGDERMYRDKAGRHSRNSGRHTLAHGKRA